MENHPHPVRRLSFAAQYDDVSSLGYHTHGGATAFHSVAQHHSSSSSHNNNNNNNNNNKSYLPDHCVEMAHAVPVPPVREESWRQYSSSTLQSDATTTTEAAADDTATSTMTTAPLTTIALFGGEGKTGREFLRLALDAGYHVQALLPTESDQANSSLLSTVHGDFRSVLSSHETVQQVQRVLRGATYCVCMLQDCLVTADENTAANSSTSSENNSNNPTLVDFMELLYQEMVKIPELQIMLYQASSLAPDIARGGQVPIMARVVKNTVMQLHGTTRIVQSQQDDVLKFLQQQHFSDNNNKKTKLPNFDLIVTRPPTLLLRSNTNNHQKLAASKSQPGPVPISTESLAEFTLSALVQTKLRNTCPYVVVDRVF